MTAGEFSVWLKGLICALDFSRCALKVAAAAVYSHTHSLQGNAHHKLLKHLEKGEQGP